MYGERGDGASDGMRDRNRRGGDRWSRPAGYPRCKSGSPKSSPARLVDEREVERRRRARPPNNAVRKTGAGTRLGAVSDRRGGTLELSSGPRVEIPPGAVEGGQDFVLKEAPKTTAFCNSEHEKPIGPTFIFSPGVEAPEGRTITVSIPLAAYPEGWGEVSIGLRVRESGEMVGAEDAEHTKWQYADAEADRRPRHGAVARGQRLPLAVRAHEPGSAVSR